MLYCHAWRQLGAGRPPAPSAATNGAYLPQRPPAPPLRRGNRTRARRVQTLPRTRDPPPSATMARLALAALAALALDAAAVSSSTEC